MPDGVSLTWDDTAFQARLQDYINVLPGDAEKILFRVAARVLADIKAGWPVDSGFSRGAWLGPRKLAPLTYQLSNSASYSRIIEYGGFRGIGPKVGPAGGELLPGGISTNRGLYARQKPSAPVRRALSKAYGQMTSELDQRLLGQFTG